MKIKNLSIFKTSLMKFKRDTILQVDRIDRIIKEIKIGVEEGKEWKNK